MKQLLIVTIIGLFQRMFSQEPSCPVFGTELAATRSMDRSTSEGLIMNFDNPALCTGTVTSWRYCYYHPTGTSFNEQFSFGVKLLVYRRMDDGLYEAVPNSIYAVQLIFIGLELFDCKTVTLNRNQQFQVQQNDIIGGCIIRNTTFNPLFIVGNINTGDTYQLNSPCTEEMLQSVNTGSLTRLSGNTLHLSAVVDSGMTFIAGNNPPPSALQRNIQGIYLNMEFPAKRNGLLTAWHFCYYTFSDPNMLRMTYTASVALWRPGNSSDQYDLVTGSITQIILNPVATLATIYCTEMQLDSTNHTEIRQGDVIGVLLPPQNPIPLIGQIQSESVHFISRYPNQQELSNLMLSDLQQEKIALHLYISEPGGSSSSSSSTVPTTEPSSNAVPATEPSSGSSVPGTKPSSSSPSPTAQANTGVIVGVIVPGLLVIIIAVVVGILIIWKRKVNRNDSKHARYANGHSEDVGISALDNVNYAAYRRGEVQPYETPNSTKKRQTNLSVTPNHIDVYSTLQHQPVYNSAINVYAELESNEIYSSIYGYEHHSIDPLEENKNKNIYADLDPYQEPASQEDQLYSQIESQGYIAMDIERKDIQFVRLLGSGQFGNVEAGVWKKGTENIPVALKTLNMGASDKDKVKFLREAVAMAQFRHPNVVTLYGIVTVGEPIILVVELVTKGDLKRNLFALRPDPGELVGPEIYELLLSFSQQIALGMQYLSAKGFVHRDLATRNVLLSDNNLCKIADFGMSRDLDADNYYMSSGGLVPVKWTAPEAIKFKKYSTASDVWSYGCVLYEIWSLGHKPFEEQTNFEILGILDTGRRLAPPPGCPRKIYHLMIRCWYPDKAFRPTFRDIILALVEDKREILEVPLSETEENSQSGNLGAPLEAGSHLYKDLQKVYR